MRTPGGRVLVRRPVRPVAVVVTGVLAEDQPQVPFARDQHLVRALAASAGDPAVGRQQPGQRGQNRPVSPRQPRRLRLALEHGELVAQDEDLGV
jgi:hypothetical protein